MDHCPLSEGISQMVFDLFSGGGLHNLGFVKSDVVINND